MASLLDAVLFTPTLGGTTDWVVSAAVQGYLTPTASGAVNGKTYYYRAESADLSQWEEGFGTWSSGTSTLTRTTVVFNSAGTTAKINFSTVPQVGIVVTSSMILAFDDAMSLTDAQKIIGRDNIGAPALGDFAGMTGGTLAASASAGALTVEVKTFSGGTPSATDPVYFYFRDSTLTSGLYTRIKVTAALSVVLGSTKTLGATNAFGLRVWITAHNDAGTVRLGAINCSDANGVFCPQEAAKYTTAVPANATKTFYSTVAITTAAPWRLIGYVEWNSLTTAGTWTAPDIVQLFGPGVKKPGDVIESRYFTFASQNSTTSASFTGSSLTDNITPKSACNLVRTMWSSILVIGNTAEINTAVLYRDGSVQVSALQQYSTSATGFNYSGVSGMGYDRPNKTTSATYQVYFHNSSGANAVYFGNTGLSTLELQEIMG